MNKCWLIGRLTADPSVRYANNKNGEQMTITQYNLAIDRRGTDEADFIQCTAFGKSADFAATYFKKGMKISVVGNIKTGSYTDKDGKKVYTTGVNVEDQEFCEKKAASMEPDPMTPPPVDEDGFMNIPEAIDEDLPFAQPERKPAKNG